MGKAVGHGAEGDAVTLTAIIWIVVACGLGALNAADTPQSGASKLLTFVGTSCLLWVVSVLCWLVVGRVMEVMG